MVTATSSAAWRLLETDALDGATNMAVDEMLLEGVRSGGLPTLRLYRWSPAAVSLGRNQPAADLYDPGTLRAAGLDLVRRPTGGRAVLHEVELTYSVTAPARWFGSARGAYRRINEVLVLAVARLGARAAVHSAGGIRSASLDNRPCFGDPADGEVVAIGRKLIGSAQLCEKGVLLQHGSLPLRPGDALRRLPSSMASLLDGNPAFLDQVLGADVAWREAADSIVQVWESAIGPLACRALDSDELDRVETLAMRYRSDEWTRRR